MAFRLLRVQGYEVSSEELAPYADEDQMNLQTIDVATVFELYRASEERIYEEESSLKKLHAWTTTFLKQQLLSNSIPDEKLHKLVEYYLKNYHGILDRTGVRQNIELYDIRHYPTLRVRFPDLCNEDFLAFARQEFNICQAQNQKELEQLKRWYADCRFDTLKFGRDTVDATNFMSSAINGDPELSNLRLAYAKLMVLIVFNDDFFDHCGSREECFKILQLMKEWKVKPAGEYGSEEVEILFTALYNTINELAEMAGVEQGRVVKEFLINLWVELLSSSMVELDAWSDEHDTKLSLDEYLSSSWISLGTRLSVVVFIQFMGEKLPDEMLLSEECFDLSRHLSIVGRLLNDSRSFDREGGEKKGNSVSILLASENGERDLSEEEAIIKIREMAEYEMRKLMQIVYRRGTVLPRKCKDMFLNVCRTACYLYLSCDEFTSPQQMKEDIKSVIYEPLTLQNHISEA